MWRRWWWWWCSIGPATTHSSSSGDAFQYSKPTLWSHDGGGRLCKSCVCKQTLLADFKEKASSILRIFKGVLCSCSRIFFDFSAILWRWCVLVQQQTQICSFNWVTSHSPDYRPDDPGLKSMYRVSHTLRPIVTSKLLKMIGQALFDMFIHVLCVMF